MKRKRRKGWRDRPLPFDWPKVFRLQKPSIGRKRVADYHKRQEELSRLWPVRLRAERRARFDRIKKQRQFKEQKPVIEA